MQIKSITALLACAAVGVSAQDAPVTGKLGDAQVVTNNPPGVVYVATLPETAFFKGSAYADGGNVKGHISAVASPDGVGVIFSVHFSNLPKEGGPFKYHLHAAPVPENGNCTATLAHLDPFERGETPPCNSSAPATCQVGDLSGKYGLIQSDPFAATYTDKFASTLEGIGAFFGNRSFVVHYANTTRITCANFQKVQDGSGGAQPAKSMSAPCESSSAAAGTGTTPPATGAPMSPAPTSAPNITGTGGLIPPTPTVTVPVTAGAALPRVAMTAGAAAMLAAVVFAI